MARKSKQTIKAYEQFSLSDLFITQVICCSQSNTSKRHGGYISIGTLRGETYFQCIFLSECILGIIYIYVIKKLFNYTGIIETH